MSDDSVKYQTLPAVHLRHVTSPTSTTTTVGHEVDIEGRSSLTYLLILKTYCVVSVHSKLWWRGSVVRTSVSGWRTFPDLCPISGWHV